MAFVGLILAGVLILVVLTYAGLVSWRLHRATGLKCWRYLSVAKVSAGILFSSLCGFTAFALAGHEPVTDISLKLVVMLEIVASGAVTAALCYALFVESEQLKEFYRRVRADKRIGSSHVLSGRLPTQIELSRTPTSIAGGWAIATAVLALLFAGVSFSALFADLHPDHPEFYVLTATKVAYGLIVALFAIGAIRHARQAALTSENARRAS